MSTNTSTKTLPKEVQDAGYFMPASLKGGPKFKFPGFGEFDLSKISVQTAATLVAGNFPYLKYKEPAAAKAADKPA